MSTCKECKTSFSVHPNDQEILNHFDAPEPTLCGAHSLQRRLAFRNERFLYKRVCELCRKDVLAMYSDRSYAKVLCTKCWYGDTWDPMQYGRDYDPRQSFFQQWHMLMQSVPHAATVLYLDPVNSFYANWIIGGRDNYLTFSAVQSEGSLYSRLIDYCHDCTDSLSVMRSELLYDCVGVTDSYTCAFLTRAEKCSDCYFGRDLADCQNCFGCVNLKHKEYHWFNEPLSKNEYKQRLKDVLRTRSSFDEERKKFDLFSLSLPVECATIRSSEDAVGNEIYNSRSIRSSFAIIEGENVSECIRIAFDAHDIYRASFGGLGATMAYECSSTPGTNTLLGCFYAGNCSFSWYCYFCLNSQDIFGCVGLRKKQFCILNKQYTEEEYKNLRGQIIDSMKQCGEWGEFIPQQYSPFAYNETLAHEFFPLEKVSAQDKNLRWENEGRGVRGKETILIGELPESIVTVDENITKEIMRCASCSVNYRVISKELERLKKMNLPIPLECQDCRYKERMRRYFIPVLHHRSCMCREDHAFHAGMPCTAEFETTYRHDAKEIVYCHACYQECIR